MKKIVEKILFSLLLILFIPRAYPGLFNSYEKKSAEENVQDLAIEQINNPTDSYVNYNLGVALYQTQKYEQAKNNFDRAILHTKSKSLKERSYFNLGNSCYKNALSMLPLNWEDEKTKIDQEKLGKAIEDAKAAVKNYEKLLELNKKNTRVSPNIKKAKELLEKLQKKQPQQQKQQGKQQDQQKQDQKDQEKQQGQQQDQQKQNQQQKEQTQDQDQADQKDQSKEQDKSAEQKQQEQLQEQHMQQGQAQQVPATAAQEQEKESAQEKAMRLMLENLQKDEEVLQKAIIQRQTRDQKPLESGQKPW